MKRLLQLSFAIVMLLLSAPVVAQDGELTVGAQVRPRAEFRNGFKTLTADDVDPALFIEQRTRLYTDYDVEKFRVHINFQDVRIWGNTNQIYKSDVSLLNVYEAWGEYRFTNKFSTRVGRMALDYDNARFFGNLGWAAQGRSHDALLLKYNDKAAKLKLDVGFAYNQTGFEPGKLNGNYYENNNYKAMQFLWLNKDFGDINVSVLAQNDGRQAVLDTANTTAYRQTFAIIPTYKKGDIKVGAEFYYQMGENAVQQDVAAYFAALNVTYNTKWTPITLGVDYASGTDVDAVTNNEDQSFAPLYGTNHKFYGFMDYFYVGNGHNNVGLTDVYLKTKFKLNDKSALSAHFHQFMTAVDVMNPANPTEVMSSSLGTEIDLVYNVKLAPAVGLTVGYSQLFATETMEIIKGGDKDVMNNWAWVQFNFNPTLVKQKIKANK